MKAIVGVALAAVSMASAASAQSMQMPDHQSMGQMSMSGPLGLSSSRDGSGTSWLPDDSPEAHGLSRMRGAWMTMLHANVFLQAIDTSGDRGDSQIGSVNWIMAMAQRTTARSQWTIRGMASLEPWTVGRCGFPDLAQSGEQCRGETLHDRQHPHDLVMELAVDYRHVVSDAFAVDLYAGAAGEPALGPAAFPHRPSAFPDPIAPISHHWLDSTHVSFGVVTAGVYGRRWKAEGSVFNGREPDDRRFNIDWAPLDSYSGRVWWLPDAHWAVQASAGHLKDAEATLVGGREDVDRATASVTYHRTVTGNRLWATTVAWGRNVEAHVASTAVLGETSLRVTDRSTVFGRGEIVQKTAADLALAAADDDLFTIVKISGGYSRHAGSLGPLAVQVGGRAGVAIVPASIRGAYGGRAPVEFAAFLLLQPESR